jgi:Uma2 family endonuclease
MGEELRDGGFRSVIPQPVGERQARMSVLPLEQEIDYPTSDGQPTAETPEHAQVILDLLFGLNGRYAAVPDAWVGGNFFLYYEEGNPKARVSPDVMLVKGAGKWSRPNYRLWQEKPPTLIVEVTSRKTRRKDVGPKKSLYERIGTEEYILFDPFGEYLRPRLQGFRLVRGRYQPIPVELDGSLLSRTTDLRMRPEGDRLRLVDGATGKAIFWPEELLAAHAQETDARHREEAARRVAEARAQAAEARAAEEEAARLAETAARRATEERLRALEAELSRLRRT